MTPGEEHTPDPWSDAVLAAALFALDPVGTGGVRLRAPAGPVRERWLDLLREALPPDSPWRRVPLNAPPDRLLGGLDLAATLQAGRPVAERGILRDADGGVVILGMAERIEPSVAALVACVLDSGELALERDGLSRRDPTRFGVVALDEGMVDDERPPAALLDRLAFHVELGGIGPRDTAGVQPSPAAIDSARRRLASVTVSDEILETLCSAAQVLGIGSLRAPLQALHAARASAALAARPGVDAEDAALAARLVLAPRATQIPSESSEEEAPRPDPAQGSDRDSERGDGDAESAEERVLAAVKAALSNGLLEEIRPADRGRAGSARTRGSGARRTSVRRGAPRGARAGDPRSGARLDVVETLRAAAPWQRLRRAPARSAGGGARRLAVRREDFRVVRFADRTETTAIFIVDASGSTALQRLAEAKGAIELLLSDCYVRRDRVALVAFRGRNAEVLLEPTRSLARARRHLAGLPGGGGTPLAAGLDAGLALADGVLRRGGTPLLVLLTDGRANVARDGTGGRERAAQDALASAREVRARGLGTLLVDTAPRPQASARRLAETMGGLYRALPHADAATLREAVRGAVEPNSAALDAV